MLSFFMRIQKDFFTKKANIVAKNLLGKILIRKINGKKFRAKIVETEAYFGSEDPASRAVKDGDLKKTMAMEAGTILVYGVHNNWLLNFVTGKKGKAEAVLIRALEPLNFRADTKGPGLLTRALKIDKNFHKKDICKLRDFWLEDNNEKFKISSSSRIGIKKDLPQKLRFYIKENKFVSRK
jgi:DNA-3-methyladenine glycosylase